MNTKSGSAAAAVSGARHQRSARNGQDAAAAWCDGSAGLAVVCDGCGAGASSEVGARLAAQLVIASLGRRLRTGEPVGDPSTWAAMRADVGNQLARLVEVMPGDREAALHDHLLFTIVAAARQRDVVAVWALGDGAYALGERVTVLGPFDENAPPYLGYDLIGEPREAHFVVEEAGCGSVLVATDGVAELGLEPFTAPAAIERYLANPDALRRQLAVHARHDERIDWDERRVERRPAALQDDGAIALIAWEAAP